MEDDDENHYHYTEKEKLEMADDQIDRILSSNHDIYSIPNDENEIK